MTLARARIGAAIAVALICYAAASAEAATVWAVHGAKNTVYLAGSVHVLKPGDDQLPAAFDRAYGNSKALVMEIDVSALDPLAGQAYVLEHGMLPAEQTLRHVVGESRYRRVQDEAERVGLPLDSLQQFEPWTVALTLTQLELAQIGFDPEAGVEHQLERRALADHKPIRGLETLEEQLAMLHGLSYDDQSRFLELSATEGAHLQAETGEILTAWRTGNERSLERLLRAEYDDFPALYRPLVTDRNRRWLPAIVELLRGDGDCLVVVGALHLIGPDGILALLRARGYAPRPLD